MADFTLDTSGEVVGDIRQPFRLPGGVWRHIRSWSDLDPFTQGYIEALLSTLPPMRTGAFPTWYGFRHLAPETIAAILKDCAAAASAMGCRASDGFPRTDAIMGRQFWERRSAGDCPGYPPLTPDLGDDGKVYLRETT